MNLFNSFISLATKWWPIEIQKKKILDRYQKRVIFQFWLKLFFDMTVSYDNEYRNLRIQPTFRNITTLDTSIRMGLSWKYIYNDIIFYRYNPNIILSIQALNSWVDQDVNMKLGTRKLLANWHTTSYFPSHSQESYSDLADSFSRLLKFAF